MKKCVQTSLANCRMARSVLQLTFVLICLMSMSTTGAVAEDFSPPKVRVIVDDDSSVTANWTESDYLANRMLIRDSNELIFDTETMDLLSGQIRDALDTVRDMNPAMETITARPDFRPNVLLLYLEPDLENRLIRAIQNKSDTLAVLDLSSRQFDELNKTLGLFAIKHYAHVGAFVFYFEKTINLPLASTRYSKIKGVQYAEVDEFLPESTDIEVYAGKGAWHFIFKNPFRDSTYTSNSLETWFFRVRDGRVDRYESDCAEVPDEIPCPLTAMQN